MTEHAGEHGTDPPDDRERSGAYEPELEGDHGADAPSAAHELGTEGVGHGHGDDPLFHDLAGQAETEAAHGHDTDSSGGEAQQAPPQYATTPAETALAAPGGTVFDVVAEPVPAWIAVDDGAPALAAGADTHYAASWAAEDGTGLTPALLPYDGLPGDVRWESEGMLADAIPAHLDELVYGGAEGVREIAARLWEELAPGVEPPAAADGEPLAGDALLGALSLQLHDPVSRSVVDAAMAYSRSEGAQQ
ncbi:MAG: hypothetical protein ACLP8S_22375 [Solirubrobacteraceae bacterium]